MPRDDSSAERHSDPALSSPGSGPPLIFVSDASAEAERLTKALRERGYAVVDVPLSMLVGRVAVQRPALILCDVDADAALETTHRLRYVPGGSGVDLIFFGEPGRTLSEMADAVIHESSGVFIRPVDTFALIRKVEGLIGPAPSLEGSSSHPPGGRAEAGPSSAPLPHRPVLTSSAPPSAPDSDRRVHPRSSNPPRLSIDPLISINESVLASSRPPSSNEHDSGAPSLPPPVPLGVSLDPEALEHEGPASSHSMSPDLAHLLARAEQRVARGPADQAESSSPPPRLSPEEEVDALLPPEVLAALDDPLDDLDLEDESSVASQAAYATRSTPENPKAEDSRRGDADTADALRDHAGPPRSERGPLTTSDVDRPEPSLFGLAQTTAGMSPGPISSAPGDLTSARSVTSTGLVPASAPSNDAARRTTPPPPRHRESGVPDPLSAQLAAPRVPALPPPPVSAARSGFTSEAPLPKPLEGGGDRPWAPLGAAAPTVAPPFSHQSAAVNDHGPATTRAESRAAPTLSDWPSVNSSDDVGAPRDQPPARHEQPLHHDQQRAAALQVPEVLQSGDDAVRVIAAAVRARFSGGIAFEHDAGIRRVVLRDGDFVTAVSGIHTETLVHFLVQGGHLSQEVASTLGRRLPPFGRHAGAALIAHGHLRQDDLWPVLRGHAEWILSSILAMPVGSVELEEQIPGRLEAEPAVFGGATGAEVLVEVVRRAVDPTEAVRRLGGHGARLAHGPHAALLGECALSELETQWVSRVSSAPLGEVLGVTGSDFAPALYALSSLGVLSALPPARGTAEPPPVADRLDDEALRERIRARRRLVDEADYFALLGLTREATAYDIRRAYLELRREFEPSRLLTARLVDLAEDVSLIVEVLDEAYDVLRDDVRRERYRRALSASP
ncbi:MAG: hypothetical protein KIT72_01420 [Polyangiaceae bacterium]|nr:hypothetical protein [Polyangiaceae bacterium]MCW5789056.1 hypothetical protein [Polyangiaceae bacterium]